MAASIPDEDIVLLYDWQGNQVGFAVETLVLCPECQRWAPGMDVDPEHLIALCDECSAGLAEEREQPASVVCREVA